MKISLIGRRMQGRRYKVIVVDGDEVGMIERILAKPPYESHWSGEMKVDDGTWRINSPTLEDVIDRVKEAYNAS